jgi:hypothetical protein
VLARVAHQNACDNWEGVLGWASAGVTLLSSELISGGLSF